MSPALDDPHPYHETNKRRKKARKRKKGKGKKKAKLRIDSGKNDEKVNLANEKERVEQTTAKRAANSGGVIRYSPSSIGSASLWKRFFDMMSVSMLEFSRASQTPCGNVDASMKQP